MVEDRSGSEEVGETPKAEGNSSPSGRGQGEGGSGLRPAIKELGRKLRAGQTDAEKLLWKLLRSRQLCEWKFRRQHPVPPYILDFYCHDARLAIELDGGQHNEDTQRAKDAARTRFLARHGIRVLRFWNHEVLQRTEAVLEAIYQALERASEQRPKPPSP